MRVAALWRFPVKSLQGERLHAVEIGPQGVAGDRRYAIFDTVTGFGLTARRAPEMLFASARLRSDDSVEITLPGGTVAANDDDLSAWLGRRVALRSSSEVVERRYENPADTESEAAGSWSPFDGAAGAFHDSDEAAVTLLSLTTIRGEEPRRFRANVVLEGAGEDAWVGSRVRIGAAVLDVAKPITRCVMVTRPQPGGVELDRDVLRWIHRERNGVLAIGSVVHESGAVRVGDEVSVAAR